MLLTFIFFFFWEGGMNSFI